MKIRKRKRKRKKKEKKRRNFQRALNDREARKKETAEEKAARIKTRRDAAIKKKEKNT